MEKLIFSWWNTALSPNARSRNSENIEKLLINRQLAWQFILQFLVEKNTDFLALGEISHEDVDFINSQLKNSNYKVLSGVSDVSPHLRFSHCYIYNSLRISINSLRDITSSGSANGNLKIAQKITINVINDDAIFILFVLHWPSLRTEESNSPKRQLRAVRLRDKIDELDNNGNRENVHIIVMGDFNEEPYSDAIHNQLKASRDFLLVKKKKHLLFNPLWKQMSNMSWDRNCSGSYFFKSGEVTKWLNLDQVMISSSLLAETGWRYALGQDSLVEIPTMVETVKSNKEIFDHLPIFCQLEKRENNV